MSEDKSPKDEAEELFWDETPTREMFFWELDGALAESTESEVGPPSFETPKTSQTMPCPPSGPSGERPTREIRAYTAEEYLAALASGRECL